MKIADGTDGANYGMKIANERSAAGFNMKIAESTMAEMANIVDKSAALAVRTLQEFLKTRI